MKRNRTPIATAILTGALAFAIVPTAAAEESPVAQEGAATEVQLEKPFAPEHIDKDSDDPVASGLITLPPVVTIDGTTYYLNGDGKTYVTELDRIETTPSKEEAEASTKLLTHNGSEVARQALETLRASGANADNAEGLNPEDVAALAELVAQEDAVKSGEAIGTVAAAGTAYSVADATDTADTAAAPRGIAAETGSNTVIKALFALVIASAIGAVAFTYGRRFLV